MKSKMKITLPWVVIKSAKKLRSEIEYGRANGGNDLILTQLEGVYNARIFGVCVYRTTPYWHRFKIRL